VSNAAEIITVTRAGRTFRCSRRTAAHIDYTVERLAQVEPDARLAIIQPCYNTGVAASAGTHDFDACLDVQIVGMDWWSAQRFLRQCGWAAWLRYPPTFSWHIHMVSLGYPGRVGIYVPGQVDDYYAHRSGLVGHVPDTSWHPDDIAETVFDYPTWEDAHMPLNKDDLNAIQNLIDRAIADATPAIAKAAAKAVLASPVIAKLDVNVRQALRDAVGESRIKSKG
jgi:hypothetical protein